MLWRLENIILKLVCEKVAMRQTFLSYSLLLSVSDFLTTFVTFLLWGCQNFNFPVVKIILMLLSDNHYHHYLHNHYCLLRHSCKFSAQNLNEHIYSLQKSMRSRSVLSSFSNGNQIGKHKIYCLSLNFAKGAS